MYYEGPKIHPFTVMEAWSRRYVNTINDTTRWSGVETWATPLTFWTFNSPEFAHGYTAFHAQFYAVIR